MIQLKPLQKADVDYFYNWINDEEVTRYSLSIFSKISSKSEINKWYTSVLNSSFEIVYGIYLENTSELIGYTGFSNISRQNNSAEYFLFIGNKKFWGQGIGTRVTEEILEIGFFGHKFNRIMLTVSEPNIGALKAYSKAGFIKEGRLRKACFRQGEYHDKIIMSILVNEFQSKSTSL
ncbi:GNAT family N-acetyltransferase [Flammeovirga kamogawensis]|uniref:GNAT family N-acetyltransferase n=1 Tax=Flammeovirga kamogawensis TaxID=373891 RepID=A0ABX8H3A1_9BACT|nr:GNAT family protein [Flammeovirga kamogawensis]MBB6460381.1 RimJ/RimL family protein N-acetyltransferase [Flammeovirga kamogawensis]QWG10188.1 GNAT family N-acetyltransferase [Flammeovirga kamogawensis]TRX64640.1 GNAT family N-acetyltransferase [Flammeovirga kamogawensis]